MKKRVLLFMSLFITLLMFATVYKTDKRITSHKFSKAKNKTAQSYSVPVYSAYGTQCQSGSDLGKAIDGDKTTLYHSSWNDTSLPDTLDFSFVDVPRIDSMIYYPRTSGGLNGLFGQTEIWYSSTSTPTTFVKLMSPDFGMVSTVTKVALNGADGILNPSVVRVVVKTGYANFASCAEMEFKTTVQVIPVEACDPSSIITPDVKQTVSSGTASNLQSDQDINLSYDGDATTFYHSNWNGGGFPITLDYKFTNVNRIDYLIYRPRADGNNNGYFKTAEIWYSTTAAPTAFTKYSDYNFNGSSSATKVDFTNPILNPSTIRIVVKGGVNNFASCAEMEFYKSSGFSKAYPTGIFTDGMCTTLKAGVTQTDIDGMSDGFYKTLAQCILNGTYDTSFRVQSYEPYPVVSNTANNLKTSYYSQYENPTGIYFEAGKTAVIFVEDSYAQNISLKVSDYSTGTEATYPLSTGVNKLTISSNGLGYINYYTIDYDSFQPIRIHIAAGKVNGYYDVNKTNSVQWKSMLKNAVTNMIDLKGNRIGMLYPVDQLKQYSPDDAKELVQLYDSVVHIEYEQMGLYKYGRVPKNHMYAEADNGSWSWYAGEKGAHFSGSVEITCNAAAAKNDSWGIAHELGHVNQIRPGLKWVCTTEMTNNIYSIWVNYLFTPNNTRLEKEVNNDAYYDNTETGTTKGKGNSIVGGRFNAYLNNGVMKGEQWLCQYGPDNMSSTTWATGADHFVKLCPIWQLELYYQLVHPEKKDWYGDVAEIVRNTNESGLTDGQLMMNFMKNTCDVVKEDLTDFFRKAGMLRTYNKYMDDYTPAQLTITATDSAAVVAYITSKNYPKPESPVMYYLTLNSLNAFKNKLAVEGVTGAGCTPYITATNDYTRYILVNHSIWKNVAVFETYAGNKLRRISMVGSGYAANDKTRVYYPADATAIYAVGWDGSRKLVYGVLSALPTTTSKKVSIYPNPVTDQFRLIGIDGTAELTLTNLGGQQLFSKKVTENEPISIGSFNKGIYLAKIASSQGAMIAKLIKK